jgi:hypothetical protein
MAKAGGGSIVNISSIMGFVGSTSRHPAYHASKGAVRIYSKAPAVRYGPSGVRVNTVHPGYMPPMLNANNAGERAEKIAATPLRRIGKPIEVAYGSSRGHRNGRRHYQCEAWVPQAIGGQSHYDPVLSVESRLRAVRVPRDMRHTQPATKIVSTRAKRINGSCIFDVLRTSVRSRCFVDRNSRGYAKWYASAR